MAGQIKATLSIAKWYVDYIRTICRATIPVVEEGHMTPNEAVEMIGAFAMGNIGHAVKVEVGR